MSEYLWQWYAFGEGDELLDAGNAWGPDEVAAKRVALACGRGAKVTRWRIERVIDRVNAPGDVTYVTRSKT